MITADLDGGVIKQRVARRAKVNRAGFGAGVMEKRTMREFDEFCLTPVRP